MLSLDVATCARPSSHCFPLPCWHESFCVLLYLSVLLSLPSLSRLNRRWKDLQQNSAETLKPAVGNNLKENPMNHGVTTTSSTDVAWKLSNTTLNFSCNYPFRNPLERKRFAGQDRRRERERKPSLWELSLLRVSWGHKRATERLEEGTGVCVRKAVFYSSIQGWHEEVVLYTHTGSLTRKLIDARVVCLRVARDVWVFISEIRRASLLFISTVHCVHKFHEALSHFPVIETARQLTSSTALGRK